MEEEWEETNTVIEHIPLIQVAGHGAGDHHEKVDDVIIVGAQVTPIAIDIIHELLHVLIETPIPFLNTVMKLVETLVSTAELARANKLLLQRICKQAQIPVPHIQKLISINCDDKKLLKPLEEFGNCIKECILQARIYSQKKFLLKFFAAGTDHHKFEELMKRLKSAISQLNLGVAIDSLFSMEEFKRDAMEDLKSLQQDVFSILVQQEESLRNNFELRQRREEIHLSQENQNNIIRWKLANIARILEQQFQNNEIILKGFQNEIRRFFNVRFNGLDRDFAVDTPQIPEHLNINYGELNFINDMGSKSWNINFEGRWMDASVTIKILGEHLSNLDYEAFIRQVEIAARLHHPNITILYGACLKPVCLVTEYMPNNSLSDYLATTQTDIDDKMSLALDVAKGLSYLQKRIILHRDLRPENILIDKHGVAKLSGFGMSKILNSRINTRILIPADTTWLAPEVKDTKSVHTDRSEIYSLGLIYRFLFFGLKPTQLLPYEKLLSDNVPEMICLLITQCLAIEPYSRPNLDKIIEVLKYFAASISPSRALYKAGLNYERSGDDKKAYQAYLQSANAGFFPSQNSLAVCLLKGKGCQKNSNKALEWMTRSANGGYSLAQYNLAKMCKRGKGAPQDLEKAKFWYQQAANLGLKKAEIALEKLNREHLCKK